MQPAVEEDLRAVRTSLERLAADETLPAAAMDTLAEAGRSLRRLERAWGRVLPYLLAENASTAALLDDLAALLPKDLDEEIASLDRPPAPVHDLAMLDPSRADERNASLRDLLARAIRALPADATGASARIRVREHLRSALELRPW